MFTCQDLLLVNIDDIYMYMLQSPHEYLSAIVTPQVANDAYTTL